MLKSVYSDLCQHCSIWAWDEYDVLKHRWLHEEGDSQCKDWLTYNVAFFNSNRSCTLLATVLDSSQVRFSSKHRRIRGTQQPFGHFIVQSL